VYLQDAHAIPLAQKSIRALIQFFQQKYGVTLTALEGTEGKLDTTFFRTFPDPERLRKVFEGYLKTGELSGAVAASVLNEQEGEYVGIENWGLYEKGVSYFLKALEEKPRVEARLHKWESRLEVLKKKFYSPKAGELDRRLQNWQKKSGDFIEPIHYLAAITPPNPVRYPNLHAVFKTLRMENRQKVSTPFHKSLSGFFQEFETYVQEVKGSLFRSTLEKEINEAGRRLGLLRKWIGLELSPAEWDEVSDLLESFGKRDFTEERSSLRYFNRAIQKLLQGGETTSLLEFYQTACRRDEEIFRNTQSLAVQKKAKVLLLVAGGFHASHLKEIFKEKDVSFILISPSMSEIPDDTRYWDYMKGDVSWKNYFRVMHDRIDLQEAFRQATTDRLFQTADQPIPMLKHWRDKILRELFNRGRIADSASYTRLLDEKMLQAANPDLLGNLKLKWTKNFNRFIRDLHLLRKQGQPTEANIARLLSQTANIPPFAIPNHTIPAWWVRHAKGERFGGEMKRSEVRAGANPRFLTDLNSAPWKDVSSAAKRAVLTYLFRRERISPPEALKRPEVFNLPLINGQPLSSLLKYYEDEAKARDYASAVGLLLYDAGFRRFEGADAIRRKRQLEENISEKQRSFFQNVFEQEIHGPLWLDLFETDEVGLFYLLAKSFGHLDKSALSGLLSEKFRQRPKSKTPSEYFRNQLQRLEPDFEKIWSKKENRRILLNQIRERISNELIAEAKKEKDKNVEGRSGIPYIQGTDLVATDANRAILLAKAWFGERSKDASLPEAAREVYAALRNHYQELKDANYQQYANVPVDSKWNPEYLNLYQLEGIHDAIKSGNMLIGDEMGVGKTVQALVVAQAIKAKRVVIVASATNLEKWADEIRKWLKNTALLEERQGETDTRDFIAIMRAGLEEGKTRLERLKEAKQKARFILINYEALKQDSHKKQIAEELSSWGEDETHPHPNLLIVDEAHRFRNETLETHAHLGLQAERMLNLSGTFTVNSEEDLRLILNRLDPGGFPREKREFQVKYGNDLGRADLHIELEQRGLMVRRQKEHVLGHLLPELHDSIYEDAPLSEEQWTVYKELQEKFIDAKFKNPRKLFGLLTEMRQVVLGLDFYEGNGPSKPWGDPNLNPYYPYRYPTPARYKKIMDEVKRILKDPKQQHRKFFIVSEFHHPIRRLTELIKNDKQIGKDAVASLQEPERDEPIPDVKRLDVIKDFNSNPKRRVLLSTLGVGGEGLDITGASIIINIDSPLTYAELKQGIDRLHRIGQLYDVFSTIYKAAGTIDERVKAIVTRKKEIKDQVLDGILNPKRIEEGIAEEIHAALLEVRKMLRFLAKLQTIYNLGLVTEDIEIVQAHWNMNAKRYSELLERLAAFPLAQLFWMYLFDLHEENVLRFEKGDSILYAPAGPATDLRALSTLANQLREATGLEINDLRHVLVDFAGNMRQEGAKVLADLVIHNFTFQPWNLVEDELPEKAYKLVISSELWHYLDKPNKKGVHRRIWMAAQLVKATQLGGYALFWVHNGRFTEKAVEFLEKNFGLTVIRSGILTLDNAPEARNRVHRRMSFILAKRTKEADLSIKRLQGLDANDLDIGGGRRPRLRRGNAVDVLSLYEYGEDEQPTANLIPFIRKGGKVRYEEREAQDVEYAIEDETLLRLRDELIDVLRQESPDKQTVKRIENIVGRMIVLQALEDYLQGVLDLILSELSSDRSKWYRIRNQLMNGAIRDLEAAIAEYQDIELPTAVRSKKAGEERAKAAKKASGPSVPKPVHAEIIKDGDLLELFQRHGYQFKTADATMPFYSGDVGVDEASKTVWVNPHLVDPKNVPSKEIPRFFKDRSWLLNLKMHLHLDALFPGERLEAAFVGLDRAQRKIAFLKKNNQYLELLQGLDFEHNAQLFLFGMQLYDLPPLNGDSSKFQPDTGKTAALYQNFIEDWRNTSPLIPFERILNKAAISQIENQLRKKMRTQSDEDAWLEDFRQRHGDKLGELLTKGKLKLSVTQNPTGDFPAVTVIHADEEGNTRVLAKLKAGSKLPPYQDSWELNQEALKDQMDARSELRQLAEFAAGIRRAGNQEIKKTSHKTLKFMEDLGWQFFIPKLQDAFSDLLSDEKVLTDAAAAASLPEYGSSTARTYHILDQILKNQRLGRNQVDRLKKKHFEESLHELAAAIQEGKISKLAPILFYSPEIKEELREFVRRVHAAVNVRTDLNEKNFRFHIVFIRKIDWHDFIRGVRITAQPMIQSYVVNETEAGWKELVKILNRRVIENPKFSNAYGIFFPNEIWTRFNPALTYSRLVRSDIPAEYGIVLVPRLVLYFAITDTASINSVSLLHEFPDYGPSLQFRPGSGIHILETLLEIIVKSRQAFAASA
jgi:SNF2 family DNA or RNA helicase